MRFDKALAGQSVDSIPAPRSRRWNTNQANDYWFAVTGGVAGAYESIATTTVGAGGQSTITFTAIASTYKHLQIRASFLTSTGDSMKIQLNGDTTANYSTHRVFGASSAGVFVGATANTTSGVFFSNNGSPGNPSLIVDILDYANTNKYKTVRGLFGQETSGPEIGIFSAAWFNSASAVSSITFSMPSGVFNQNSKFALYGIKG
jgi:hypothetical protein